MTEEELILRRLLWLNHGHTGMYGDDGEMQCSQCFKEYGFFDWKRTPAREIEERMIARCLSKNSQKKEQS